MSTKKNSKYSLPDVNRDHSDLEEHFTLAEDPYVMNSRRIQMQIQDVVKPMEFCVGQAR